MVRLLANLFRRIFSRPGPARGIPPGTDLAGQAQDPSVPWVGVDLDGTLAVWDHAASLDRIGPPVPAMLSQVNQLLDQGVRVKIFTARASDADQIPLIREWMARNGLPYLEITNVVDAAMARFYDDRGVRVEKNTGRIIAD